MPKKAPRRTKERILQTTLDLFNRFGEPNVSTTLISSELGISPGNLYYHYPSKDALIECLFDQCEAALLEVLDAADGVRDVEDAWFFLHTLFERIWTWRFLYRDLNHLLSRNRRLETHLRALLEAKATAMRRLLEGLGRSGEAALDPREIEGTSTTMVVVVTYWLSYEYMRDPRRALEPDTAQAALGRGVRHAMQSLVPYLQPGQRQHLLRLSGIYAEDGASP